MNQLFSDVSLKRLLLSAIVMSLGLLVLETVFLDVYGNEPSQLLIAQSMVQNGQWLVPHLPGTSFLSGLPTGYGWLVALFALPVGEVSALHARVISIMGWLGVGGLVWGLSQSFKTRFDRVLSVVLWLFSLAVFLSYSARAEPRMLGTLFVVAAAGSWLRCRDAGRGIGAMLLSHTLLALALLTSGPGAYLFFYVPLLFLHGGRNTRLPWLHGVFGAVWTHLIVGGWFWALRRQVGGNQLFEALAQTVPPLVDPIGGGTYFYQLLAVPANLILAGLPLSLFLLYFAVSGRGREILSSLWNDDLGRTCLGGLYTLVPYWLLLKNSPGVLLPVVPWAALLVGTALDRASSDSLRRRSMETVLRTSGILATGMLLLPWYLSSYDPLLGSQTQWLIAAAATVIGIGCVFFPPLPGSVRKNALAGLVSLVFLVKIIQLFLYVPVRHPERLTTSVILQNRARAMAKRGEKRVIHFTREGLVIPYYLEKHGIDVRVQPSGSPDPSLPVITREKGILPRRWLIKYYLRLSSGDVFYYHVPRKIGGGRGSPATLTAP